MFKSIKGFFKKGPIDKRVVYDEESLEGEWQYQGFYPKNCRK